MKTCNIEAKYSSNYAGVFSYKSSSRTKHNWHCIIELLINAEFRLMLLISVYFILYYHLFFRKEIYFFESLYFSESDIRMPLYVFWLRKRPSITYVRNCTYKSLGKGWLFCAEVKNLLSKLIFTHFVSCWSHSDKITEN